MNLKQICYSIFFIATLFAANGISQPEALKPSVTTGDVVSINSVSRNLVLQTKENALTITFNADTVFKKVPPGNPKLSAAVPSLLSEILVGDKLVVSGFYSADKISLAARSIYLMAKAEIAKKIETEREMWRARGISGKVSAINSLTRDVTISVPGLMSSSRNVVIKPKENAVFKRYAPDSANFDDAKPSSFAEVFVGDQLIALGDKSTDGATFSAEQIVSGSFKMVGGTITAIDAAKNEITLKDIQSNKPTTIVLNNSTLMKKIPADFVQMLVSRMSGAQSPPNNATGVARPAGGQQPAGNGQPPQGAQTRGGGRFEFDEMLNSFPSLAINELKAGDAIAVSTTSGVGATRVIAIKLLSGVEPLFRFATMARGRGGNSQGGPGGGFSIPGLDGIGFP